MAEQEPTAEPEPAALTPEAAREQAIAELASALATIELDLDLDDGDILTDALLLAKVSKANGNTVFLLRPSRGSDLITQRGLIALANDIARDNVEPADDDE